LQCFSFLLAPIHQSTLLQSFLKNIWQLKITYLCKEHFTSSCAFTCSMFQKRLFKRISIDKK
jgi:hypothetical protein